MKFKILKTSFLVALLSILAACSSTSTEDTSASETVISGDEVTTGTVDSSSTQGNDNDLGAGGIDTVFYFEFDKSLLNSDARAALNIHARRLRGKSRSIRVEGHADERGTREYNMALGERRANAVKEYLVLQGVNASSIEAISYGEESPAQLASNEQSWSLNRRVEMK